MYIYIHIYLLIMWIGKSNCLAWCQEDDVFNGPNMVQLSHYLVLSSVKVIKPWKTAYRISAQNMSTTYISITNRPRTPKNIILST